MGDACSTSQLCEEGEENQVHREDPPLAGRWISGRGNVHILGLESVQWKSGDVSAFTKQRRFDGSTQYHTELNGTVYTAVLSAEGQLQWSDGDTWTKDLRAPETGTYAAVSGVMTRAGESFHTSFPGSAALMSSTFANAGKNNGGRAVSIAEEDTEQKASANSYEGTPTKSEQEPLPSFGNQWNQQASDPYGDGVSTAASTPVRTLGMHEQSPLESRSPGYAYSPGSQTAAAAGNPYGAGFGFSPAGPGSPSSGGYGAAAYPSTGVMLQQQQLPPPPPHLQQPPPMATAGGTIVPRPKRKVGPAPPVAGMGMAGDR